MFLPPVQGYPTNIAPVPGFASNGIMVQQGYPSNQVRAYNTEWFNTTGTGMNLQRYQKKNIAVQMSGYFCFLDFFY